MIMARDSERAGSDSRSRAAFDILIVLATLYVIKSILLKVDALWTYAGPISLVASFAVAWLCLRRNREDWKELGLKRPPNATRAVAWSLGILIVTMAAGVIIEFAISSAGVAGTEVDPRYAKRFADLPGNTRQFLLWVTMSWVVGGFVEEMLFRGLLLSRFERILGAKPYSTSIAVVLQAVVFGQQHFYYQGWSGALATGGIALISGALFIFLGRNLWPLIVSHALANTIGLTLIYAGVQAAG
jgi:uncharacterized protein